MYCGDKNIWQEIQKTHRTPFDIVNADGENFQWLQKTDVDSLHKDDFESLQTKILNSKNRNFWGVILGRYGSGKTHLLQRLKQWAFKNKVFFIWIDAYYGKNFIDFYLIRNILDKMINSSGFSGKEINILQEMVFSLLKVPLERILTSGDPDWTEKVCKLGFFSSKDKKKEKILRFLNSPIHLPELIQEIDLEKILQMIHMEYKSSFPTGISEAFQQLLRLAFSIDLDEQRNLFKKMMKEDATEIEEEDAHLKISRTNLVNALCFLISRANIPVCMVLDQFESFYHKLQEVHLDTKVCEEEKKDGEEIVKIALNNIFGGFEKFFNDSSNISLVFTCQIHHWKDLDKYLEDQIHRRIDRPPYYLKTPTLDESIHIIQNRLNVFWEDIGMTPDLPVFESDELEEIVRQNKELGKLYKVLRSEFLHKLSSLASEDFQVEKKLSRYQKRLQFLQDQINTIGIQQKDVMNGYLKLNQGKQEKEAWLREYVESCRLVNQKLVGSDQEIYELRSQLKKATNDLTNLGNTNDHLSLQVEHLQKDKARLQQQLREIRQMIQKSTHVEVETSPSQIDKQDKLNEEIENLQKKLSDLMREKQTLDQKNQELENKLQLITMEAEKQKLRVDTLDSSTRRLSDESRKWMQEKEELMQKNKELESKILSLQENTPKNKEKWYPLLQTRTVKVNAAREFLHYRHGIDPQERNRLEVFELMIEKLTDEQIEEFIMSCYNLGDLRELAQKYRLPATSRSKRNLIQKICNKRGMMR